VQRESPLSIPQAFDPNASTPSAQNRACRGGRPGCKILPSAGGTPATTAAFSLVELLVVITIIIVLAGLVLSTMGYVRKKGARSRAETEIAAISAACESYKADNGIYPRGNAADPSTGTPPFDTDNLDAKAEGNPSNYAAASLLLYKVLSGDINANRQIDAGETGKSYFAFKPNMLLPAPPSLADVTAIRDPFGNSYGYSTANQADSTKGYNPTFDLWSTCGETGTQAGETFQQYQLRWIKNW
jgi:type II secretory pathway pseudopilin PulG